MNLTEGSVRKGGRNAHPSAIAERPAPPAPMRPGDDDIWVTSAFEFYVGGLRFAPGTYALKRLKQEAADHGF